MPRLVVEKGRQKGKSKKVGRTSVIVVGRGNTADLQLNDPMTSRRHFSVEFKKGDFFLVDLKSANGTYLNGERIREHVLELGDKIQAGEMLLSFLADKSTIKHDTVTGQTIAGYLIEERVGRGAMGTVYKAVQLSLDRTVALKILARELVSDKSFIDMFVREAQNAGLLNHQNIVQVYDVGEHNNIYYISMEYMAGGSVYEMVNREGAQPFERALEIAVDSARGLRYAEKHSIVHRDIKPDNLMLSADGTTKIGDMGIARHVQAGSAVLEEGIFGSPHYMAPEQAQGLKIDCRTDIYSLGATMYHVLTGETPFTGKSPQEIILKQINERPSKLLEVNPTVPSQLAAIVEKCMDKDPDERYQRSEELLEELEEVQSKAGSLRMRLSIKERAKHFKKRYFLSMIVVVVAIVVGTIGFFAYRQYQRTSRKYQRELGEAKTALAAAESLLEEKKPDEVLEALKRFLERYADFPEVAHEAEKLELEARTLKETIARKAGEKQAAQALAAAREFEKANPDKLTDAVQMYAKVISDFPDTGAAREAKTQQRRLNRIIEERRMLEISAQAQVNAILKRSRKFRTRKRYGKALDELADFEERYHRTEAAKEIEAERDTIMKEARRAFALTKQEANNLIAQKKYDDAKAVVLGAIKVYEIPEFTDGAAEIIKNANKLIKQLQEERDQASLAEDREKYEKGVSRARKMILDHRFETAATEYRSLQLLLKSEQYRLKAGRKVEEIDQIKSAKTMLINQINRKKLARPIRIKVGNNIARAVRATNDKLVTEFENREGVGAEYFWKALSASQMVSFLGACSLDARGHLAAGIYAKELGSSAAARKHFDKAVQLDSTLKGEVARFSGDLK